MVLTAAPAVGLQRSLDVVVEIFPSRLNPYCLQPFALFCIPSRLGSPMNSLFTARTTPVPSPGFSAGGGGGTRPVWSTGGAVASEPQPVRERSAAAKQPATAR